MDTKGEGKNRHAQPDRKTSSAKQEMHKNLRQLENLIEEMKTQTAQYIEDSKQDQEGLKKSRKTDFLLAECW